MLTAYVVVLESPTTIFFGYCEPEEFKKNQVTLKNAVQLIRYFPSSKGLLSLTHNGFGLEKPVLGVEVPEVHIIKKIEWYAPASEKTIREFKYER